jgi:hypothetical protein
MKVIGINILIMATIKEHHTWQQGLQSRKATMSNQEQLMKQKIKYLEDRITTMEKSLSRINNILGRFQMTENKPTMLTELPEVDIKLAEGNEDYELI